MTPKPKTHKEIKSEIEALKSLKPVGRFAEKTQESINLQIEELEYGIDQTADEWNDLTEEQQYIVNNVLDWKDGYDNGYPPSKGWRGLVEK